MSYVVTTSERHGSLRYLDRTVGNVAFASALSRKDVACFMPTSQTRETQRGGPYVHCPSMVRIHSVTSMP